MNDVLVRVYNMLLPVDLPEGPGWLPTWQLIVAVTAAFNTISNMTSLNFSRRLYNNALGK